MTITERAPGFFGFDCSSLSLGSHYASPTHDQCVGAFLGRQKGPQEYRQTCVLDGAIFREYLDFLSGGNPDDHLASLREVSRPPRPLTSPRAGLVSGGQPSQRAMALEQSLHLYRIAYQCQHPDEPGGEAAAPPTGPQVHPTSGAAAPSPSEGTTRTNSPYNARPPAASVDPSRPHRVLPAAALPHLHDSGPSLGPRRHVGISPPTEPAPGRPSLEAASSALQAALAIAASLERQAQKHQQALAAPSEAPRVPTYPDPARAGQAGGSVAGPRLASPSPLVPRVLTHMAPVRPPSALVGPPGGLQLPRQLLLPGCPPPTTVAEGPHDASFASGAQPPVATGQPHQQSRPTKAERRRYKRARRSLEALAAADPDPDTADAGSPVPAQWEWQPPDPAAHAALVERWQQAAARQGVLPEPLLGPAEVALPHGTGPAAGAAAPIGPSLPGQELPPWLRDDQEDTPSGANEPSLPPPEACIHPSLDPLGWARLPHPVVATPVVSRPTPRSLPPTRIGGPEQTRHTPSDRSSKTTSATEEPYDEATWLPSFGRPSRGNEKRAERRFWLPPDGSSPAGSIFGTQNLTPNMQLPDTEVQRTQQPRLEGLEIRQISAAKGRGVFATQDFAEGELVESAPIIVIPGQQKEPGAQVAGAYIFPWKQDFALLLGYGSLYNHSFEPNAVFTPNYEGYTMLFRALRPIHKGEEICINYHSDPNCHAPLPPNFAHYEPASIH
ncbi:putative SET domain protein [Paratrimastix pyriformis]|uniref:SET domain protein n=1 Tax=Paratrimastix pyriformis TaxID=342808 RepID=A0ABQ8UM92_9EUKA|nr:putative SET domain protein [Paratrimastix pyriformis]